MKLEYTLTMHLMSTAFSSMMWAWVGLFEASQTLQVQLYKSLASSLPTIKEFANVI
jgi:hypothetical protein